MLERDAGLGGDVGETDLLSWAISVLGGKGQQDQDPSTDYADYLCNLWMAWKNRFTHSQCAPSLSVPSTFRVGPRLPFCDQRRCTRGRADNEHGPDRVSNARQSRDSR